MRLAAALPKRVFDRLCVVFVVQEYFDAETTIDIHLSIVRIAVLCLPAVGFFPIPSGCDPPAVSLLSHTYGYRRRLVYQLF